MTVFVELNADPPRLRRADGLIVRFPKGEDGGYPVIEAGWLGSNDDVELLFRWRGFGYQELQPGKDAALLVGHVASGGYCSAAVTMNADGVRLEFADKVAAGGDGMQRMASEFFVHDSGDVVVSVGDETSFSANVDDAPGGSLHRLRVERSAGSTAVKTCLDFYVAR
jgi:hypothetical protein